VWTSKIVTTPQQQACSTAMSSSKTKLHSCNMSMLTETSTHSALASGRWVVRQMNMQDTYVANQVYLLEFLGKTFVHAGPQV
jgi:hypothetical protein